MARGRKISWSGGRYRSLLGGRCGVVAEGQGKDSCSPRGRALQTRAGTPGDTSADDNVPEDTRRTRDAPAGEDPLAQEVSVAAAMLEATDDDESTEMKENRFLSACRDVLALAESVPPE